MVETVPTIAFAKNTGEISDGGLVQRQKKCLDGTEPERELTGGAYFQRDLWKAVVSGRDLPKNSFCTIEYWRDLR